MRRSLLSWFKPIELALHPAVQHPPLSSLYSVEIDQYKTQALIQSYCSSTISHPLQESPITHTQASLSLEEHVLTIATESLKGYWISLDCRLTLLFMEEAEPPYN